MKNLKVKTENKTYDILIKNGILNKAKEYFGNSRKIFLITNDNLLKIYPDFINSFDYKVVIKDGENHKNFETFEYIINELLRQKIERKDKIVVFGGGVTGDLAGYAAASVLRGVDFIQIPTTLLSQVDSSVGGKTGFNTSYGKNLIGAFYQPDIVLIDPDTLKTLSEREIKSGMGEVVKYAFIEKTASKNKEFYIYDYLKGSEFDYSTIIYKCCGLKADVVSSDEKEKGLRAILNLGHTFAHAIETITNYTEYTHGEAVSMGIKSAFELSLNLGLIDKAYFENAFNLIDKFNLASVYKIDCDKNRFIEIMKSDKKVISSKIRLVLPISCGEVKIFDDIEIKDIKKVI